MKLSSSITFIMMVMFNKVIFSTTSYIPSSSTSSVFVQHAALLVRRGGGGNHSITSSARRRQRRSNCSAFIGLPTTISWKNNNNYSHKGHSLVARSSPPQLSSFSTTNNLTQSSHQIPPSFTQTSRKRFSSSSLLLLNSSNNNNSEQEQVQESVQEDPLSLFSKDLEKAYKEQETDGILLLGQEKLLLRDQQQQESQSLYNIFSFSSEDIIIAALNATKNNKGNASSILNALLASCSYSSSYSSHSNPNDNDNNDNKNTMMMNTIKNAELVWDLYTTWIQLSDSLDLQLNIVTYCNTYSALQSSITHIQQERKNKKKDDADDDNDDDEIYDYIQNQAEQVLESAKRYSKKIAGSKRRKLLTTLSRKKPLQQLPSTSSSSSDEIIHTIGTSQIHKLQTQYGIDFHILYENRDVIVLSKPSGMVCFHSHKTTSGKVKKRNKMNSKRNQKKRKNKGEGGEGNEEEEGDVNSADISLEDALLTIGIPLSTLNPEAMGIVHRLDRGTSGCIILAKNDEAHARLVTEFFKRNVQKSYLALVPKHNNDNDDDDGSEGGMSKVQQHGVMESTVGGRPAYSTYEILESYKEALLVKVQTKTGRKHQVRVHLANDLNRPIFLDPKYDSSSSNNNASGGGGGGGSSRKKKKLLKKSTSTTKNHDDSSDDSSSSTTPESIERIRHKDGHRFFLNASTLQIDLFRIEVEAPLPSFWQKTISELSKEKK